MYFCDWIFWAVQAGVLDPKLTFFTDEVWFHLSRYITYYTMMDLLNPYAFQSP
jgi:hypothetical protein